LPRRQPSEASAPCRARALPAGRPSRLESPGNGAFSCAEKPSAACRLPFVTLGSRAAIVGGTVAAALAVGWPAYGGSSSDYDATATRAAAKADRGARITRPDPSDLSFGSTARFAFELARNKGEVSVFRSHSAAEKGLAEGKLLAKGFGVSLNDDVFVVGNVVIGFDKTPTKAERREVEGWLRTH
jgi:hypothetical protein